ncbi:MAG: FAD-dependent oxidoreductase, partial [Propionibacteriaceae bacterium]|nr:FAD-dependent oxidoreductase [Propionibacteriaceae bacterium]
MTNVVILGGGPGGYDAALVARQLGADVTVIERAGMGGSAVLTDVVPSKALVSAGQTVARLADAQSFGLRLPDGTDDLRATVDVDMAAVNARIRRLADDQSRDQARAMKDAGVTLVHGIARLDGPNEVVADTLDGERRFPADLVLVAVGAHPRILDTARPDGERILTWAQLYRLEDKPRHLIVVGSGVTGAEFASAYHALGIDVTLVSSRHQVLPSEDNDAAAAIQQAFTERGIHVINDVHATAVTRIGDDVVVRLHDGREVTGSHCLVAVGSIPNTTGIGLEEAGVTLDEHGYIVVDRVSRTSAHGVYAAGDCTNGMKLASVASMQGRIAMWHGLGDS